MKSKKLKLTITVTEEPAAESGEMPFSVQVGVSPKGGLPPKTIRGEVASTALKGTDCFIKKYPEVQPSGCTLVPKGKKGGDR